MKQKPNPMWQKLEMNGGPVANKILQRAKFNPLKEWTSWQRQQAMAVLQSRANLESTRLNVDVWRSVNNNLKAYTPEQVERFLSLMHKVAELEWGEGTIIRFDYPKQTVTVINGDRAVTI